MPLPSEAALEQGWRVPGLPPPAVVPGPGRVSLGAAGPGGTCRQMSVSPLCQQPGASVSSPGDVARRPLHFLPSRAGFGGGSVPVLRPGEQRDAGKGGGPTLTPQISSLSLRSTSHPLPYLPCAADAELPLCIAAHP